MTCSFFLYKTATYLAFQCDVYMSVYTLKDTCYAFSINYRWITSKHTTNDSDPDLLLPYPNHPSHFELCIAYVARLARVHALRHTHVSNDSTLDNPFLYLHTLLRHTFRWLDYLRFLNAILSYHIALVEDVENTLFL